MRPVAPQKDGPQSNEEISSPDVQLIDGEGANRGVVRTRDAIAEAQVCVIEADVQDVVSPGQFVIL